MDIKIFIVLLPAVFIFHDFEEIILFKPWLEKNRREFEKKFPRLDKILFQHFILLQNLRVEKTVNILNNNFENKKADIKFQYRLFVEN